MQTKLGVSFSSLIMRVGCSGTGQTPFSEGNVYPASGTQGKGKELFVD